MAKNAAGVVDDTQRKCVAPRRSVVLLVHGTYAAQVPDAGGSWWQRESDFHDWFVARMGSRVDCQPAGRVFHWTGENSEWARQDAGRTLAEWIRAMEGEQQPYHLVGHSHGGSVIWNALRDVATDKNPLSHLRSWTTIGTPFLHYRARKANLYFLLPVVAACCMLALSLRQLRTWWELLPSLHTYSTSRVGLFAVPVLCVVLAFVAAAGVGHFYSRFQVARRERSRQASWNEAYRIVGQRHLALWSPDDEAVNGLRGTLGMEGEIIPRVRFGDGLAQRVAAWALARYISYYEMLFARPGDEFIFSRVSRKLQGNDTAGLELASVGAAPLAGQGPQAPLPEPVCLELRDAANRYAAAAVAGARNAMGLVATSGSHLPQLVTGFSAQLTGRELIHTTYYDAAPVRELIRRHVDAAEGGQLPGPPDELDRWLAQRHGGDGTPVSAGPVPAEYKNLARVAAFALTGVVVAAASASRSFFDTTVRPLTAQYQVEQTLAASPLREAVGSAIPIGQVEPEFAEWFDVLVRSNHSGHAVRSALEVDTSDEARLMTLALLSHSLLRHHDARAAEVLDSALALTRRHPRISGIGPYLLFRELAHAGRTREINSLLAPVLSGPDVTIRVVRENLAVGYMHAGQPAAAEEQARQVSDVDKQVELADSIAAMLRARQKLGDAARAVAWMDSLNALQSGYDSRRMFRKRIALHYALLGQTDSVRARLTGMGPREKVSALVKVALAMDSAGRRDAARTLMLALADTIRQAHRGNVVSSDEGSWHWAAADVGNALAEMGMQDPARAILAAVDDSKSESPYGARLEEAHASLGWARLGDSPRALGPVAWDTTSSLDEPYLKELAGQLVLSGRATESLPWIERIRSPDRRLRLLSWIAPGLGSRAERTLAPADSLAGRIGGETARSRVSAQVAIAWAKTGNLHRARALTGRCLALDRLRIYTAILAEHWKDAHTDTEAQR